jgi:hypothetical protein
MKVFSYACFHALQDLEGFHHRVESNKPLCRRTEICSIAKKAIKKSGDSPGSTVSVHCVLAMGYSDHIHLETGALVLQFRLARESSSEILDWQVEVLTLALDETITANFKIRGDGFVQPMFFKLQNASFG